MIRLARWFSSVKAPIEAIKRLRQETSSPIGECKKALEESNCDHEKALQWLKNKGMVTAEKKAEKSTREGVIAARTLPDRKSAVLLEVNCQTDFVAKNELFLQFVDKLLSRAVEQEQAINFADVQNEQATLRSIEGLLKQEKPLGVFPGESLPSLFDQKKLLVSRLQQNIRVRRVLKLQTEKGKFGIYVHRAYQDGIGLQACLMEMFFDNPEADEERCREFCDNIATQYLGSPPKYLSESDIPAEVIAEQTEKVKQSMAKVLQKAPPHAHERMIKGKLNSILYEPYVFRSMGFILASGGDTTVNDYWKETEHELSSQITLGRVESWKCK